MKLLFDSSVFLTQAFVVDGVVKSRKTGFCRFATQTYEGLLAAKDIDTTLCYSIGPQALNHLKSLGKFAYLACPYPVSVHFPPGKIHDAFHRACTHYSSTQGRSRKEGFYYGGEASALEFCASNTMLMKSEDLATHDIIYFPAPQYTFPTRVKRFPNLRTVLTIHDLIPLSQNVISESKQAGVFLKTLESYLDVDLFLAVSEYTKEDFCFYTGISPERVRVTALAADPNRFYPVSDSLKLKEIKIKYGIPDAPFYLTLSRLTHHKNIISLLKAFMRVHLEIPVNLVLVASLACEERPGALKKVIKGILKEESDRLIHITYVEDEDLATLYSAALGFVFPSLYEGFGLPPLEAMQCGLPVICSNTSSLPEVTGDAALTHPPLDVDLLADHMVSLYQDSTLQRSLREKGLKRAKLFSWNKYQSQIHSAFKTLV